MVEIFKTFFTIVASNWYNYLLAVLIMVSAIIAVMGILKPLVFDKVSLKPLRKALLALTSVAFSFVATAGTFLVESYNFDWYWISSAGVAVCTIVIYWLYENTCLRDLIGKLGNLTIKKVGGVIVNKLADEKTNVNESLKTVNNELKEEAKFVLKSTATTLDNELKNL